MRRADPEDTRGPAFRQPVKDDDPSLEMLLRFYQEGRTGGNFETGIQRALARVLVDPRFIFRMEHVPANLSQGAAYRLTDLELATRLSFFLWSSIPDETLLNLAISKAPIRRCSKSRRAGCWRIPSPQRSSTTSPPNGCACGNWKTRNRSHLDFDGNLRLAFQRETQLLFESILQRTAASSICWTPTIPSWMKGCQALWHSNVKGSLFRRVTLANEDPRRGILGKGSVLLVTSAANRTSPVQRGQWVLGNLLGSWAPTRLPALKPIWTSKPMPAAKTVRERMEQHRSNAVCASCHSIMDPIGFSLENFDLVGKWRENEGASRIDATAEMVDGTRLEGLPLCGARCGIDRYVPSPSRRKS